MHFVATGLVKTILLSGIGNKVLPSFVNFSLDLDGLRYRSSRNAAAVVGVFCEVGQ